MNRISWSLPVIMLLASSIATASLCDTDANITFSGNVQFFPVISLYEDNGYVYFNAKAGHKFSIGVTRLNDHLYISRYSVNPAPSSSNFEYSSKDTLLDYVTIVSETEECFAIGIWGIHSFSVLSITEYDLSLSQNQVFQCSNAFPDVVNASDELFNNSVVSHLAFQEFLSNRFFFYYNALATRAFQVKVTMDDEQPTGLVLYAAPTGFAIRPSTFSGTVYRTPLVYSSEIALVLPNPPETECWSLTLQGYGNLSYSLAVTEVELSQGFCGKAFPGILEEFENSNFTVSGYVRRFSRNVHYFSFTSDATVELQMFIHSGNATLELYRTANVANPALDIFIAEGSGTEAEKTLTLAATPIESSTCYTVIVSTLQQSANYTLTLVSKLEPNDDGNDDDVEDPSPDDNKRVTTIVVASVFSVLGAFVIGMAVFKFGYCPTRSSSSGMKRMP